VPCEPTGADQSSHHPLHLCFPEAEGPCDRPQRREGVVEIGVGPFHEVVDEPKLRMREARRTDAPADGEVGPPAGLQVPQLREHGLGVLTGQDRDVSVIIVSPDNGLTVELTRFSIGGEVFKV